MFLGRELSDRGASHVAAFLGWWGFATGCFQGKGELGGVVRKTGTEALLAVASSIHTASFYLFVVSFRCLGYNLTSWYVLLFTAC